MLDIKLTDLTAMAKRMTIPISVLIEVCYTCNEKCVHCCLSNHTIKGMTLGQYENLFDQLVEAGTFFVILTGGEPFTRADFMEIVEATRKRRLSVTIFTNGTLITDRMIARLQELYVQEVHVSIYGADPATHDAITRVAGSFVKSIETIQRLLASGTAVRIKCPLMNTTVDGIESIKALAKNLGVNVQYTTVITAQDNGQRKTHGLRPTPDQRQITGGNVLTESFGKIWKESPVFQRLRQIRLKHLNMCPSCELFQYCTRCPGLAHLEDGDMYGCSAAAKTVAEERRKIGVYPAETHIFSQP